ncbi:DNA polymerase III subunit chi [Sphingobium aquiterrae]|uniref:DNA polymerase III subunit chi n=1 Tax=Sphingobium aquiterrae TaxID=2038656 RepID=UPI003017C26A
MRVDFYQLSRQPVEQVLPVIAGRLLDGGARLVVVGDDDRLRRISQALWTSAPTSFLAHARAGEGMDEAQPILLSSSCEAANGATNIALADGLWRDEALGFARSFYFFDAETIDGARAAWRALARNEEAETHFWRQDGRKWVEGP